MSSNEHTSEKKIDVRTEELKSKEEELLKKLEELKHICFGMYTKIIPPEVREHSPKTVLDRFIKSISDSITDESIKAEEVERETVLFYTAFFQTSIYYLLATCREEDQILLSLRKLADTFNTNERISLKKTAFFILMNEILLHARNEQQKEYAQQCKQYYQEFERYYEQQMLPEDFRRNVRNGVNAYADKNGYSCISSEQKYSDILRLIDSACNDAYFSVYQKWER